MVSLSLTLPCPPWTSVCEVGERMCFVSGEEGTTETEISEGMCVLSADWLLTLLCPSFRLLFPLLLPLLLPGPPPPQATSSMSMEHPPRTSYRGTDHWSSPFSPPLGVRVPHCPYVRVSTVKSIEQIRDAEQCQVGTKENIWTLDSLLCLLPSFLETMSY